MPPGRPATSDSSVDVQPVFGEPALLLKSGKERALAIADLHIGLKYQWEKEGVFIPDQKRRLVEKLRGICVPMRISHLIVIGDFKHHVPRSPWKERKERWEEEREKENWDRKIGDIVDRKRALEERMGSAGIPSVRERDREMLYRLEAEKMRHVTKRRERRAEILDMVPSEEEAVNVVLEELSGFLEKVDIVKGNHDGRLERMVDPALGDFVTVHKAEGFLYKISDNFKYGERESAEEKDGEMGNRNFDSVGFFHGHKWPHPEVVAAQLIVIGHTHYSFLFEDKIGARVIEPIWVRGMPTEKMRERYPVIPWEFVLMPSFNPLLSTKPINSKHPKLYGPLLRNGYLNIQEAGIYLFDGTALGKVGDFVSF